MKVKVLFTGKTTDPWIRQGVEVYAGRIRHYVPFELTELRDDSQILKSVRNSDYLVLLDEHGETFSSLDWARNLEQKTAHLPKDLVFVIGGPYGFPAEVRARCDESLSLSRMTFSHQLVRLVFLEQLYRAFTIIKGEPYHHE
ncbi:MAG: 23S rRNA (pseudouridine(1915)-N(3))-methyltransferase RlmH [Bacteroidales bacterium]|nr:23S rRNA (pseudouridine(1915)-N(3))-methyltransferase RlmH [Bacteroidales bacterium]